NRLVYSLRGQLKRAEVHRDAAAGAEIEVRLHRFSRIHVDVLHAPARLIGADRQERQVDRGEPRGDLPEMGAVPRIAGKEDPASPGLDQESAPQRAIAVEGADS